jgi:hypothetical protein
MSSIAEHATTGGRQLARRLDVRSDHHADSGARRKEVASPRIGPALGHVGPANRPSLVQAQLDASQSRLAVRGVQGARRRLEARVRPLVSRALGLFGLFLARGSRPSPSTRRGGPAAGARLQVPPPGTPGTIFSATQHKSRRLCATQPRARQTGRLLASQQRV